MDEDGSVFFQDSETSYSRRKVRHGECDASGSQHSGGSTPRKASEGLTLNIVTTAQQPAGEASPSPEAEGASPGSADTLYVYKTVTISHSPLALHADGHAPGTVGVANTSVTEHTTQVPKSNAVRPTLAVPRESSVSREATTGAHAPSTTATPLMPEVAVGSEASTLASHAGTGSSVRDEAAMAYSGPIREKPLIPENMAKGKAGVAAPLPLAAMPKSQLRVAPTGRSDSDTDDDDGDTETCSTGPASPPRRRTEEEEEEDEQRFVDEFGFVIDEDEKDKDEQFIRGIDGKQVARREIKWANMASDWDRTNYKMHAKLKERCRKGIPGRLRGVAWQLLTGSRKQMMSPENAGVYMALRDKKLRDKEVDEVLGRDLTRTFPNHVLFKDEGGVGQTFLRNVLHAYAGCDPEVGYTQGMAFVVGTLSTQMAEEESFWALHELMYNERYKMRELYRPGFPLLHQFFYQVKRLLGKLLPRLSKRFEELEIEPSFYASQWFMTLFVYHFPFRAVLRIWDVFFSEGWKIIFRTGLALMKWEEKRLLAMPYDELLPTLKSLAEGKDAKELMQRAHRIKFKTADLNRYGDEYWAAKGTTLDG